MDYILPSCMINNNFNSYYINGHWILINIQNCIAYHIFYLISYICIPTSVDYYGFYYSRDLHTKCIDWLSAVNLFVDKLMCDIFPYQYISRIMLKVNISSLCWVLVPVDFTHIFQGDFSDVGVILQQTHLTNPIGHLTNIPQCTIL